MSASGSRPDVGLSRHVRSPSTPSLPPENAPLAAQPAPSIIQVAAPEAAPPQATPSAQTTQQYAAPRATAALPDQTQLLQTMARDLADMERKIEQLKTNQQQTASENKKAIEELKTSHEEIKRVLARVSEQNLPKMSPPPTQPTPTLRKPERTLQSPHARARHRIPREWFYDDERWPKSCPVQRLDAIHLQRRVTCQPASSGTDKVPGGD